MPEIKFDMGHNIHETAKKSGAPKYSTRDIQGFVSYAIVNLAPEVSVKYIRQGYEFTAAPLFALTLYTDRDLDRNMGVQAASLQYNTRAISSHESAKIFVENLIAQFQKRQWRRYIQTSCPAVTGRSVFLNEAGTREQLGYCPLDPAYRLTSEEWIAMMFETQNYKWLGDGILASLTVSYSNGSAGPDYSIQLELDDFAIKTRRDATQQKEDLAEGDAAGWKSTENYEKDMLELKLRIKAWEEAARKRGDLVIPRQPPSA